MTMGSPKFASPGCLRMDHGREIDSAIQLADFMAMSATFVNVAEFKDWLTEYLAKTQSGEEILVCRRNVPMVKLLSYPHVHSLG